MMRTSLHVVPLLVWRAHAAELALEFNNDVRPILADTLAAAVTAPKALPSDKAAA